MIQRACAPSAKGCTERAAAAAPDARRETGEPAAVTRFPVVAAARLVGVGCYGRPRREWNFAGKNISVPRPDTFRQ